MTFLANFLVSISTAISLIYRWLFHPRYVIARVRETGGGMGEFRAIAIANCLPVAVIAAFVCSFRDWDDGAERTSVVQADEWVGAVLDWNRREGLVRDLEGRR